MVQKHHLEGHVNTGVILLFFDNFDNAYNAILNLTMVGCSILSQEYCKATPLRCLYLGDTNGQLKTEG